MSVKIIKQKYPTAVVKKTLFKDYNYSLYLDNTEYVILVMNVNKNSILSINSKHIWEIKQGRANGISFKTSSKSLIDMRSFNKYKNKIVVFKSKPYKILKYINENEVVDISLHSEINDIKIFNSIREINV